MKRFGIFCDRVIYVFAFCILLIILVGNAAVTAHVSYDEAEIVSYTFGLWYLLLLPLELGGVLLAARFLKRFSVREIFRLLAGGYILASFYFILNTENHIRADAAAVYNAAWQMLSGSFEVLQKDQYIGTNPHQIGLMLYDMLVVKFSGNEEALYFLNAIEILIINWYGYRITDRCFENTQVDRMVLLLEFLFIPQFFFILFGYGVIPGFCCFMIAAYHAVCINHDEPLRQHGFWMLLFVIFASLFKKNYCIGAMAIGIVLILRFVNGGDKRKTAFLGVAVVLLSLLAPSIAKKAVGAVTDIEIGSGVPSTAWIAMGTDLENEMRAPGWFDGYNYSIYEESGRDSVKASALATEKIIENVKSTLKAPKRAILFYGKKMLSMWSEPMFQSVWSGPGTDGGALVTKRVLKSLYSGGKVEKLCNLLTKCVLIATYTSALCFLVRQKDSETQLFYLYFIGGFIFHLFWEAKSQYVYTYVFMLLPICANELCALQSWLDDKLKR